MTRGLVIGLERFFPSSISKQISYARALTSQGWPRVRFQTEARASSSKSCPVSLVCSRRSVLVSSSVKFPSRSDFAFILNALPPVMIDLSLSEWIR